MEGHRREAVRDPVTRLWHWVLAASVITGRLLGEFRTCSIMQGHIYCGYLTGALLEAAREARLLIGRGGLNGHVVRIGPSLLITEDEMAEGIRRLGAACRRIDG